jgi:DNA-binding beta-propeller fold protein YncE
MVFLVRSYGRPVNVHNSLTNAHSADIVGYRGLLDQWYNEPDDAAVILGRLKMSSRYSSSLDSRSSSRAIVVVIGFLSVTWGCGDELAPLPAHCEVDLSNVDFGNVLPALSSSTVKTVTRDLTISNQPLRTSPAGNEDLSGTITFILQTPRDNPPTFHLIPEDADAHFVIPPKQSVTYRIATKVRSNTSTGSYAGILDLGTSCAAIPFGVYVAAREEDPPSFLLQWGTEGSAPGEFSLPYTAAIDPSGNIYVIDRGNERVQKFDSEGNYLFQWHEWDERDTDEGLTSFSLPVGIAADETGHVYVTDTEREHRNDRITKFDSDGNYIKRWGPTQAQESIFDRPWHLHVDGQGYLYVVNSADYRILKLELNESSSPGYNVLAVWGSEGNGPGKFRSPYGIAVDDRNGHVYVSDWVNQSIQKFANDGTFLLRWGGSGTGSGEFNGPAGLSVDEVGNIYVADQNNHRIQKFDENGAFLTEWGTPGVRSGEFFDPVDVTTDQSGAIYTVDATHPRIQKFSRARVP